MTDDRCDECLPKQGLQRRHVQGIFGFFDLIDDSFTWNNDWDGTLGHEEDMLMYHAVFGLSAGIPLCCVTWWIQQVHVKHRMRTAEKAATGVNPLTKQSFAMCPAKRHEWPDYVAGDLMSWNDGNGEETHDVWKCGCGVCTNWNAYVNWFIAEGWIA